MKSYCFVYWTYIKKTCEWGPVYIEKSFSGVTLPAPVNLSRCLYEKQLTILPELKTAGSRMLWFSLPNRVDPGWASHVFTWRKVGLVRKVTLPSKKGSSPAHYLQVSRVIKRQVSVRKCRKCWLAKGSRRVGEWLFYPGRLFFIWGATLQFLEDLRVLVRKTIWINKVWNLAGKQKSCGL